MNISAKVLCNGAQMPKKSDDGLSNILFACLYNDDDGFVDIEPHSDLKITTGVQLSIPEGYVALILPLTLDIAGGVAVITPSCQDEICVVLHNDSDYVCTVNNGQAIAKIIVVPAVNADFI